MIIALALHSHSASVAPIRQLSNLFYEDLKKLYDLKPVLEDDITDAHLKELLESAEILN